MFKIVVLLSLVVSSLVAEEKVFATVDGEKVTMSDVNVILAGNPNVQFEQLPKSVQDQIISRAIDKKLLTKKAKKSKVRSSKEYKEALAIFEENLLFNLWLKQTVEGFKISKKDIRAYYKENKSTFETQAQVKAKHILVKEEKVAKDIIKKLTKSKNLKTDFESTAKTESVGPSGQNGGELGWFEAGKMVPEFSKAAFATKKGAITKSPVKTQFGYHIIYVEDTKDATTKTLKEVEGDIKEALRSEKMQSFIASETEKLRKKAKIKIN